MTHGPRSDWAAGTLRSPAATYKRKKRMNYVSVSPLQLLVSLGLMALAIAVSAQGGLRLERDMAVGTVRAAVQLFAVGLLLSVLFQHERPIAVLGLIAVMVVVAGWTAARRISYGPGTGV